MDYIKDVEERLRKYKNAEETIINLNNRLKKLSMRGCPREVSAVDFSKIGHGSCSNEAFNDLVEVQHLMKQINNIEDDKEIIENTLNIIKRDNKEDYDFIDLKYLQELPMDQVAVKLGYSSSSNRTIYSIKDRALSKFALLYWGV